MTPTPRKSWSAFDTPLVIDTGHSRVLPTAVVLLHLASAVGLSAVPGWIALSAGPVLLWSALRGLRHVRRRERLIWQADHCWSHSTGHPDGGLQLGACTFVSRWLIVVALVDSAGTTRQHVLARDGHTASTWRRLAGRLRIHGPRVAVATAGWHSPEADP